ncbi:unnamed protein product [Rhizophagus irregularis]|nr:unnamed protein product [Rhizophagus irregularis]
MGDEEEYRLFRLVSARPFTLDRYQLLHFGSVSASTFILDRYLHSGSVSASTLNFGIWICIGFDPSFWNLDLYRLRPFALDRYRLRLFDLDHQPERLVMPPPDGKTMKEKLFLVYDLPKAQFAPYGLKE